MAYTTIDDPEAYFQVKLYTGNGTAIGSGGLANTFDGDTDLQPDMVWIKNRDATDSHQLFDAVRGVTKRVLPDVTTGEETDAETLTTFGSDGFTVGDDVAVNTNTEKYVAWCWKANGSGSANTVGDINSTVSVNTTSGLSIVKYVGSGTNDDDVGHGLGAAPKMILFKNLSTSVVWIVGHDGVGWTEIFFLNTTAAKATDSNAFNNTTPSSTVFTLGPNAGTGTNETDSNFIAYCFANVQGFSKFGTYEGNGNANGTFVYTGFRPAFVMTKSVDSTSSWEMFDNKREGYNVDNDALVAEVTTVEATADQIDLLSNGFKLRIATDPNVAETYMYMAFAEAPFVNSNGVPCNAR